MKQTIFALGSPLTEVYVGDCRKAATLFAGQVDLAFGDPPFNIDRNYGDHELAWNDNLPAQEYWKFTEEWLDAATDALSPVGSLFVNIPDQWAAEIAVHLKKRLQMVNWFIWHYRFGQHTSSAFISSKVHCLHFARDKSNRIWHPEEVLEASDRAAIYNDPRTQGTKEPGRRVPFDVWGFEQYWGRVQGNNKERRKAHDNQLPELYMDRIIRSASNPESLCLDCFAGSGTFGTVARALGRRSVSFEINPEHAKSASERMRAGAVRIPNASHQGQVA